MKMDKESVQTFGCCRSTDDISVENSVTDPDIIEIEECHPTINIKNIVHAPLDEADFPKRLAMDVEFQDIKYTVGKFSFRNRKYGKTKTKLCKFSNILFVLSLLSLLYFSNS